MPMDTRSSDNDSMTQDQENLLSGFGLGLGGAWGSEESYVFGLEVCDWTLQLGESNAAQNASALLSVASASALTSPQAQYADNHVFTIKIWVNQHIHSVQRTYSAFCKLHLLLTKYFPRSTLPSFPLSANLKSYSSNPKSKTKEAAGGEDMTTRISMVTTGRESLFQPEVGQSMYNSFAAFETDVSMAPGLNGSQTAAFSSKSKHRRLIGKNEVVSQRKQVLTSYLNALKDIPEIAVSDIFISFLDESYIDGFIPTLHDKNRAKVSSNVVNTPALTDIVEVDFIDVLLSDVEMKSKFVVRKLKFNDEVSKNDVIVWKFSSLRYDIGFHMKLDGEEVLTYQRYNSHIEPIKGFLPLKEFFTTPLAGTKPSPQRKLSVIWDNKYSLMRSKQLNYCYKVVTAMDIETAKGISTKLNQETQRYMFQRQLLIEALHSNSRNHNKSHLIPNTNTAGGLYQPSPLMITNRSPNFTTAASEDSTAAGQSVFLPESTPAPPVVSSNGPSGGGPSSGNINSNIAALQQRILQLETELIEERMAYSLIYSKLDDMTQEKDELAEANSDLTERVNDVSGQLEELRVQHEDYRRHSQGTASRTEEHIADLQRQLSQANETIANLTAASAPAVISTTPVSALSMSLAAASIQAAPAPPAAEDSAAVAKLKAEKKQLRTYALERKSEAERLQTANHELEKQIEELKRKLAYQSLDEAMNLSPAVLLTDSTDVDEMPSDGGNGEIVNGTVAIAGDEKGTEGNGEEDGENALPSVSSASSLTLDVSFLDNSDSTKTAPLESPVSAGSSVSTPVSTASPIRPLSPAPPRRSSLMNAADGAVRPKLNF